MYLKRVYTSLLNDCVVITVSSMLTPQYEEAGGKWVYYNRLVYAVPVDTLAPIYAVLGGAGDWPTMDLQAGPEVRRVWELQPSTSDRKILSKY